MTSPALPEAYLALLQTPDRFLVFDTFGPVATAIFFISVIATGFLFRKVVWGTELTNEKEERSKEVSALEARLKIVEAERDYERSERRKGEAEIREIQEDYRRVIDDYKALFNQLLFAIAGDALKRGRPDE